MVILRKKIRVLMAHYFLQPSAILRFPAVTNATSELERFLNSSMVVVALAET